MDLKPMVGESVHVVIDRKKTHREYVGRLVSTSKNFICLEIDNRLQWLPRPNRFNDVIELEGK